MPCTHAMLAKWIPPNERSRMGAFVYAGESHFIIQLIGCISDLDNNYDNFKTSLKENHKYEMYSRGCKN